MDFDELLSNYRFAVERLIHFKISDYEDAEDIIQETYLTAFVNFSHLKNSDRFKQWIISIAKNKCNNYYRRKSKSIEIAEYDLSNISYKQNIFGRNESSDIMDVINVLNNNSKEILKLYYFDELSQEEISKKLNIPIGTVKSRLHYAKQKFKEVYPYSHDLKGATMSKLPNVLPEYKIIKSDKSPFETEWQELMGWLIIPKPDEKITWAMYDFPERKQTQLVEMEVVGEAEVHSVKGVEIIANEHNPVESEQTDNNNSVTRKFIAQLTDTHCRFLAESHKINGVTKYYTFLDDEEFTDNWGFGPDNCGKETHLLQKNIIERKGDVIQTSQAEYCMDIVGRYIVTIGNKEFDTVCVMDIESYDKGVVTEQYIDQNGRTILWRRFNANDWHFEKYNKLWSEILPYNEMITVNGKTYVHWYDCISDYMVK